MENDQEKGPQDSRPTVFDPVVLDLLNGLFFNQISTGEHPETHHKKAVNHFSNGEYFEAHEEWEILWRKTLPESPDRHALQSLIRLCAAGVKLQGGNFKGFKHHFEGCREHLHQVFAKNLGDRESWQSWEPFLCWVDKRSHPGEILKK